MIPFCAPRSFPNVRDGIYSYSSPHSRGRKSNKIRRTRALERALHKSRTVRAETLREACRIRVEREYQPLSLFLSLVSVVRRKCWACRFSLTRRRESSRCRCLCRDRHGGGGEREREKEMADRLPVSPGQGCPRATIWHFSWILPSAICLALPRRGIRSTEEIDCQSI